MVHATLEYLIHHNVGVIQTLFGVLFLLLIFLILRSFREEPVGTKTVYVEKSASKSKSEVKTKPKAQLPDEASPLDDLDNLEELMGADEKANLTLDPSQPATPKTQTPDGGIQSMPPEVQADLQRALTEKEKTISDLKSEIENLKQKMTEAVATASAAPAGAPVENNGELESKLKELTDKLSEYEIIEEDIANLSFYKNENAKLKDELDKMKAGGAVAAAIESGELPTMPNVEPTGSAEDVAPSVDAPVVNKDPSQVEPGDVVSAEVEAAPTPVEAPAAVDSSVVNEFEEAIKQKEMLDQTLASKNNSTTEIDADILKEFENVVKKEWGGEGGAPVEPPSPVSTETAPSVSAESVAAAPAQEATNITTEAPADVASSPSTLSDAAKVEEPVAASVDIDTNKLMTEVEAIAETQVPDQPSAPLSEEESKQKLIEEFESFINKAQ